MSGGALARAAEIQIGLANVLLQCEEPEAALLEIEAALLIAPDQGTLGKVQSQRAMLLARNGRHQEALEQSESALHNCRGAGLDDSVARLLSNRGLVHAYLGEFKTAETELTESLHIFSSLGSSLTAAQVLHNLGFLAARRGDIPVALSHFDQALKEYGRLGLPDHAVLSGLCEVYLAARLLPEAREAGERAVQGLAKTGLSADLAEARLLLADVALASGDLAGARLHADTAQLALARQGRRSWALLAEFVASKARWASDPLTHGIPAEAQQLALGLEAAGWRAGALEARIAGAQAAIEAGDPSAALGLIDPVGSATRAGSSDERARAWHAVALGRLAAGNTTGALRALKASIRIADSHRAAFGATELRARVTSNSTPPAELGLQIVLGSRNPQKILEWSELSRSRSLMMPRVLPPADPELADHLTELRHTVARLEQATEAGDPTDALEQRRRRLESKIRARSLRQDTRPEGLLPAPFSMEQLQGSLRARALVEFVEHRGQLHALVCSADSCVLRDLGPSAAIGRERAALRFAFSRLARRRASATSLRAAAALLARSAAAVERLVFGPVASDLDVAGVLDELVIVPTGALHAMPWAMLCSLRQVPVSVAPSAAMWLKCSSEPRISLARLVGDGERRTVERPVVLAAGPGIRGADREIGQIASVYPNAVVLTSGLATTSNVATFVHGASVFHVAAHGVFRADNPLFSSLGLADGPLTVYDLETIGEPPEFVVLSACDSGRSAVQPGDELLGTTAAMLGLGTRAIVASVVPVPDAGAPQVMTAFHRRLASGVPVAKALSVTQSEHAIFALDPEELVSGTDRASTALAASAFVCCGAGSIPWGGIVADLSDV